VLGRAVKARPKNPNSEGNFKRWTPDLLNYNWLSSVVSKRVNLVELPQFGCGA